MSRCSIRKKMKEEANDHIKEFTKWLHGVPIKKIPQIKYEVNPKNLELVNYVKERQERRIMSSLAVAD